MGLGIFQPDEVAVNKPVGRLSLRELAGEKDLGTNCGIVEFEAVGTRDVSGGGTVTKQWESD